MMRRAMAAALAVLVIASGARAQAPARFRWQTGQVLVYRIEQSMLASEVVGDTRAEDRTRHTATQRWQVLAVDPAGVATLQLSNQALMYEATRANGDVLRFDSANLDKSTPQLREQFSRYVGQPLAVLRVDGFGRVVEVKESKFGSAGRFEVEPPFVGLLPPDGLKPGQAWERSYPITLGPPHGTGEKYVAVQRYACKGVTNGLAAIGLTTEMKTQPEAAGDRVPLLEMQPEGEMVFDLQAGRLHSAALRVDKELKGHDGEGSSYHFQSTYTVQYAGDH
jgi:hypothetical protein